MSNGREGAGSLFKTQFHALTASGREAIASRLEAIAARMEAIAITVGCYILSFCFLFVVIFH